ncbi:MAG: capsular biosynthesis protein CpsI [Cytophagales bacterium CG18_big_fil_WC_8_21_14_2_50_42_9]|nr:MAG: capsular biosynthesis protein CpsI [Cytophagales bacterium CG18_big_fil_WC_8_21_14_2_50_42_9]
MKSNQQKILITGSAGFIGHHLTMAFQQLNFEIVGLDSINSYYDPVLKFNRLEEQGFERQLIKYNCLVRNSANPNASFIQLDLTDENALEHLFREQQFDYVINLAAQAGVRYSLEHPQSYVASNLVGFANILENCRNYSIKHLLFASSSSVYGQNSSIPFRTGDQTDYPISFYAATKKANEVMAYSYAHLYKIPTSGMRFFTVYGPWGRPDMAYFSFAQAIKDEKPIRIFNNGDMHRDFTYIDDVVNSIIKLLTVVPEPNESTKPADVLYKVYNIGNSQPEPLFKLVTILEQLLHKKAILDLQPMPPGDVQSTYADIQDLAKAVNYCPSTPLEVGLTRFIEWFESYYKKPNVTACFN